ncbi:dolichol-phosphate mannosyltransferase subunit 3 [Cylindrobasidium torrendii FP15055 ss-10]|uniref:Dolichol-phosphate mannosyltransferase subunit 3 n=1 Tax=Cylindrobasidium torrendii FP15055 ss-10 TaxID=1314674 RepID=A0A0D7AZW1_9AGAR|nr:dolichol-phosphate mannosyltransferase subunit 3 [Cylindrobasidium torrendii FP15055 ss-10]
MARAHRVAGLALLFTVAYTLVFYQFLNIPFISADAAAQIIPVLPWWLLVSFGAYSLWALGWGLWTFQDCPNAFTELMVEINQAKNELRAKGVTVD